MAPHDTIVAFTDGVTDIVGDGGRFGSQRPQQLLTDTAGLAPAEIVRRLDAALGDFQVGAQADDTAVVVVRYTG